MSNVQYPHVMVSIGNGDIGHRICGIVAIHVALSLPTISYVSTLARPIKWNLTQENNARKKTKKQNGIDCIIQFCCHLTSVSCGWYIPLDCAFVNQVLHHGTGVNSGRGGFPHQAGDPAH